MKTKEEIMLEIENVREKLNKKMVSNDSRIPDEETIELSEKLDSLLNLLN